MNCRPPSLNAIAGAFALAAADFCLWCDGEMETCAPEALVRETRLQVASLYVAALRLPECDVLENLLDEALGCPVDTNAPAAPELEEAATCALRRRFGRLPVGYYRGFFHPGQMGDEDPCVCDLADDLLDMYDDLRSGLWLYENGNAAQALWEWKFSFEVHWGRHAADALYALKEETQWQCL